METIKIISYNVNGIRAALRKGLLDYIKKENPDVICFQETKAIQGQAEINLPEYTEYWHSAERKGYSGTAIFTKIKPLSVVNGFGEYEMFKDSFGDAGKEGRVITAEFEKFFLVTVYTPNSKRELTRLVFRHKIWDSEFLKYVKKLELKKPVVFCGDLNVAHEEIDLANPKTNHFSHGFTDEEREGFNNYITAGFVDTFRIFNKEGENYSWWSPFAGSKQKNLGWRIDYVNVSKILIDNIQSAFIRPEVNASDHCPVGIEIQI